MSKEKRLAAKEEKQKIAAGKRVIEIAHILGNSKEPVSRRLAVPEKNPAHAPVRSSGIFNVRVNVSTDKEDREGAWSWGIARNWEPKPGNQHIDSFLSNYHKVKTWREVFQEKCAGKNETIKQKHIKYDVSNITYEAQKRLVDLKLDDFEVIFRFRMTNLERLYGFIFSDGTFYTVWYDPTHQIYPVD